MKEARQGILALVSLSIPIDQAEIVAEIVAAFIVPNSFVNSESTKSRTRRAREGVLPVVQSFVAGELVVGGGSVVTEADFRGDGTLRDADPGIPLAGPGRCRPLVAIVMLFLGLFLRFDPVLTKEVRSLIVFGALSLIFLVGPGLHSRPDSNYLPLPAGRLSA